MNVMKKISILGLFLTSLSWSFAYPQSDIKVQVRVFEIPMIQSIGAREYTGKGGFMGGDITEAFPDGMLIIPTELENETKDVLIIQVIQNKVNFGIDKIYQNAVSVSPLGIHSFQFMKNSLEAKESKGQIDESKINLYYELSIAPKAIEDKELLVKIRFMVGWHSEPGGRLSTRMAWDVMDPTTIGLAYSKWLLIGFPSHDYGPRGTIYWLALYAEKTEKGKE